MPTPQDVILEPRSTAAIDSMEGNRMGGRGCAPYRLGRDCDALAVRLPRRTGRRFSVAAQRRGFGSSRVAARVGPVMLPTEVGRLAVDGRQPTVGVSDARQTPFAYFL